MIGSTNRKRATRSVAALGGVLAVVLAFASPALADGPRTTRWVCQVPEGDQYVEVVFVTAAAAALHGITRANTTAGDTFADNFGESCTVE